MAKIIVHSSSAPRALLDKATELLLPAAGSADPLQTRWVIQPGRLWEQALRRNLADNGISASLTFGSLRLTLERAFRLVCPGQPLMNEDDLFWSILNFLLRYRDDPAAIGLYDGTAPAAWLKANEGNASLARVRLARLLQGILDDHASYRPAEVLGWLRHPPSAKGDEAWIAALARRLWADGKAPWPLPMRLPALIERISSASAPLRGFPASVVAILTGAQPQAYLEGLGRIARVCPVHLLVLETCEPGLADSMATWGKVRRMWKKSGCGTDLASYARDQHWLVPGTLQSCWGDLGIALQQQLVDLEDSLKNDGIAFEDLQIDSAVSKCASSSALQVLQQDIRVARDRRPKDERLDRHVLDTSAVLINAPSALRELEGARDAIRGALASDTSLQPSDVLMILTDTRRYAPLLPAVFGSEKSREGPDGLPRIPWHLADRSLLVDSDIMAAVLLMMEALRDRITLPVIGDLLAQPVIQAKLGLSQDGAMGLVAYLQSAGFRWGLNSRDRKDADQPGRDDGLWTLDFALRRLAAGFAHPDRTLDPVGGGEGITPLSAFEGSGTAELAGFIRWASLLEQAREAFCGERPLDDGASGPGTWLGWLQEWMPQLLEIGGDREGQSVWLGEMTRSLAGGARRLDKSESLSTEAFTALLDEAVAAVEQALPLGRGMGGMVVASARMARALPARVIVVVGLSDGVWPRQDPLRPRGLLATPRAGDRMRREEDRLVTLEWVLSAETMLVWTWQGRDQQNGAPMPASVVVDELLDVCRTTFKKSGDLVSKLPLHAFDTACFKGPNRSFDRISAAAALNLRDRSTGKAGNGASDAGNRWTALPVRTDLWDLPGFTDFVLKGSPPSWTRDIWARFAGELVKFWRLPCQAFLRSIGVGTEDEYEFLPDREALRLDSLEGWGVRDVLIKGLLDNKDAAAIQRQMARAGLLPPGKVGAVAFKKALDEATAIVAKAKAAGADVRPLSVMTWEYADKLVRATASKVGGKQLLQARIEQMVLAALHDMPVASEVFGNNGRMVALPAVGKIDALQQLQQLSALAMLGTAFPLPYFPGVSSMYEAERDSVACAEEYWNGPYTGTPESDTPACRIAFRGLDPLGLGLPEAPRSPENWQALISICKLDKDKLLFEQLALTVYAFMEEIKKKAREQAADDGVGTVKPASGAGAAAKGVKARGGRGKQS
ncbi:MAG: exodeoxyribonuclease V subunit gamma [bacterium]